MREVGKRSGETDSVGERRTVRWREEKRGKNSKYEWIRTEMVDEGHREEEKTYRRGE